MKHYFSHDANARNDEKILMLRAEHGWEGYGLYWALVEMLFEGARSDLFESDNMKLRKDKLKGLAIGLSVEVERLESVVDFCIQEGLFVCDGDYFWSNSLIRRSDAFKTISEKRAEAGRKGGRAKAKPKHLLNNSQAIANQLPSKVEALKETKREKTKLKEKDKDKDLKKPPLEIALDDFYDMRKKMKSTMTDRAKTILANKLESLASTDDEKIELLEQSIMNGWKSVYSLKTDNGKRGRKELPEDVNADWLGKYKERLASGERPKHNHDQLDDKAIAEYERMLKEDDLTPEMRKAIEHQLKLHKEEKK